MIAERTNRSALIDLLLAAAMLLGVAVTYRSPRTFEGEWRIGGADYYQLHARRIDFALEQLRDRGTLPAWYPREFMGSPFWSNVQSFPFIPVRLAVVWAGAEAAFTLGVWLSGTAAAGFTFLWLRRVGVGAVGAAAAGWTFAASGYFASRVTAGHLPLLEAFCALPLLLWCVEGVRRAAPGRTLAWRIVALAVSAGGIALAGHPQVPMYALAAAGAYVLVRLRGARLVRAVVGAGLGVGLAAFAVVPMTLLVGRSSRVLDLDPATNDLPLPYWRLKAMLWPWADGAPAPLEVPGVGPFGHPSQYFWDTVTYVGWLPVLAMVTATIGLIVLASRVRPAWLRADRRAVGAVLVIGLGGLALALPWTRDLTGAGGVTFFRSPARLAYLYTFAAATALGLLIDALLAIARPPKWNRSGVIAAVAAAATLGWHGFDLYRHTRPFVTPWKGLADVPEVVEEALAQVGDGRVGIDTTLALWVNRRIDDAGFFDSIMLANVYAGLLDLGGGSPRANVQRMDAAKMPTRVLQAMAVRLLLTTTQRRSLPVVAGLDGAWLYAVPDSAMRAAWFPAAAAEYADATATRALLRDQTADVVGRLILPAEARLAPTTPPPGAIAAAQVPAAYRRIDTDRIEVEVDAPVPGFVRVLEAYDPGWEATVNSASARVWPAHSMAIAVPVPAGRSVVRLEYFTPGRNLGLSISAASAVALGFLAWKAGRERGSGVGGEAAGGEELEDQRPDPVA